MLSLPGPWPSLALGRQATGLGHVAVGSHVALVAHSPSWLLFIKVVLHKRKTSDCNGYFRRYSICVRTSVASFASFKL